MEQVSASGTADALRASLERALAGQYRVVRLLGRGGMGAVFLAREESLERLVAIKVLPPGREDEGDSRERFRREARMAARLAHPNIVPLHGFGEVDGMMYLAMGYVNGESLAARLKRDAKLPADETRRILADVAEALDYAHRRGVIHRDVKPDNILIDDETGRALLADFGIAKGSEGGDDMTRTGLIVGTPLYMSPEQARGEHLDGRSDLYSLGAVGYALLSGRAPFEGSTPQDAIVKRLTQEAPPLEASGSELPADLAAAVNRCLARERERRFPDARAFRQAIAPQALEEDELPEPLDALDGKVASVAVLVVALSLSLLQLLGHIVEHDYRRARRQEVRSGAFPLVASLGLLGLVAMQVPMLTSAAGAARRRGFSRAQIAGAFFRQPRWWPCFWYPRRSRRKDDMWDRLPAPFRQWRVLASIVVADLIFFIALASIFRVMNFLDPDEATFRRWEAAGLKPEFVFDSVVVVTFLSVALAFLLAVAAGFELVRCARLMRSHGLETYELRRISRAFLVGPTADRALWKKPELARLLLPPRASGLKAPASPREYTEALARVAAGASGEVRQTADRAAAAARSLAAALAAADQRVARLNRDLDPKDLQRLDERLAVLGAADASEDEERRELRRLLSGQRELLRRYEGRLQETRARRERALRLLEELWRRAPAGSAADRAGQELWFAAVAEAEAFLGDVATPADAPDSNTATRVRPGAAG
jgi:serine/threonine protein kinase